MRYDEITQTITASRPDEWAVIAVGPDPIFLEWYVPPNSDDGAWPETSSHGYVAVYREDADLRLAWGLTAGESLTYDGWAFADSRIDRELVDAFWRGALVARWSVLQVDGGRSYMPMPDGSGRAVKASEATLARLVQHLAHGHDHDVDKYLQQVGADIVADLCVFLGAPGSWVHMEPFLNACGFVPLCLGAATRVASDPASRGNPAC